MPQTMEEAEETCLIASWNYAWDIPTKQSIKEVTIEKVANKFGVSNIKIVKSHLDI